MNMLYEQKDLDIAEVYTKTKKKSVNVLREVFINLESLVKSMTIREKRVK